MTLPNRTDIQDMLRNLTFGIPVFHCYGHRLQCQVEYSPRRLEGIGLTDGETMERLWSYLRRFKKITKEMQEDHRIDLLVDGLMHFGEKLKRKMMSTLCQKYDKAVILEDLCSREIRKVAPHADDEAINTWAIEEQSFITVKKSSSKEDWMEEYALKLYEVSDLRNNESLVTTDVESKRCLSEKILKLEKSIQGIEEKWNISERWTVNSDELLFHLCSGVSCRKEMFLDQFQSMAYEHLCLKEAMKKYADGQAVAIRLSRQLKVISQKIQVACSKYNSLPPVSTEYPDHVTPIEVKDFESSFWSVIRESQGLHGASYKRQAIDIFYRMKRAHEEQGMLKNEMGNVLQYQLNNLQKLDEFQIISLFGETSQHLLGGQALIKQHIYMQKKVLHDCISRAEGIIDTSAFQQSLEQLSVTMDTPIMICQPIEDDDTESDI